MHVRLVPGPYLRTGRDGPATADGFSAELAPVADDATSPEDDAVERGPGSGAMTAS